MSSYVKAGDLVRRHQRHGQWLERAGVRDARALEHALTDLAPQPGPPPRAPAWHPRAPGSVRPPISTWLLTEPGLTPMQIWERLLDEHHTETCYTTVCHYRSTISSHYRCSSAFRAGIDTRGLGIWSASASCPALASATCPDRFGRLGRSAANSV